MSIKSVTSPSKFYMQKDLLNELGALVKQFGKKAYVIVSNSRRPGFEENSSPSFAENDLEYVLNTFGGESSDDEINANIALLEENGCDFVIGLGGGKVLDTAKAVAHFKNLPVVIIPSLASTDAPCTALTVIYNNDGSFNRYLFLPNNPNAVLVDSKLIAESPQRFFAAGVGDGLATYFEARACYNGDGINLVLKKPALAGLGIAKMCYETIRDYSEAAIYAIENGVVTPAVENVIEATVYMSGVGAESGGLAAAHSIHNGMTAVSQLDGAQHGEKVAFGTIAQLILEGESIEQIEEVIYIMKTVGLPLTLEDMGMKEFVVEEWKNVAELSCAEGETIHNHAFEVTPDMVYDAIVTANNLLKNY